MRIKHPLPALSPTLPSLSSPSLLQIIYYLSIFYCFKFEWAIFKTDLMQPLCYFPFHMNNESCIFFSIIHHHTAFQALKLSGTNTDPTSLVHVSTVLLLPMEGNYKILGSGASNIITSVSDFEISWSPGWEVKIMNRIVILHVYWRKTSRPLLSYPHSERSQDTWYTWGIN